jgi:AcrR family transcriptional regulator
MQARSAATRQKILQAALSLFSQSGYDATGVAEICRAAGVSKGAFYYHFPSKQALFLDLLEGWLADLDRQLVSLGAEHTSVPQAVYAMADLMPQVFQAAGGRFPILLEFWTQARREPAIREAVIAPYRRYQDFFTRLIEEGITAGSLEAVEARLLSQVIVSLAVGMLLQGLLDPVEADWQRVARQGLELLFDGITGSPT